MWGLLSSGAYRLLRDRRVWVALVLVVAIEVLGAAGSWFGTTPEGAAMNPGSSYDLVIEHSHLLTVSAPAPTVVACVLAALLAAEDAESGFSRTLGAFTRSRARLAAARLAIVLLVSVAVVGASAAASELAFRALGFEVVEEGADRVLGYLGLVALQTCAYASVTALVTWLVRSKAAGVACAVLVGGSLVGAVVQLVLVSLSGAWPVLGEVALWLPSWAARGKLLTLGAGALWSAGQVAGTSAPAHVALVAAAWVVIPCAAGLIMESRRDVS